MVTPRLYDIVLSGYGISFLLILSSTGESRNVFFAALTVIFGLKCQKDATVLHGKTSL